MSYYDLDADEPEKSYHLFILGLLVLLEDTYTIKSNRESGYGRYDSMLIPHDRSQIALIIEFKKARKLMLEQAAQQALVQIKDKKYAQELKQLGCHKSYACGIAFMSKEVYIMCEKSS